MEAELQRQILERLKAIEDRIDEIDDRLHQVQRAYGRSRVQLRRLLLRPPMWTFEQHPPRQLRLQESIPALPASTPSIAIVTPSYNQARYLRATIESILGQNYPRLRYHVQDGGSDDGSVDILKSYGERISWRSGPDQGQADAINLGFQEIDSEIMAYLNSDDVLSPGTLAYVANVFQARPDIDVVYGHRVFIDADGMEIGRAVFPRHSEKALLYSGYIPQESMFWRRRVWDKIGAMDASFQYALDWDFQLRAQAAGFRFLRARRFLACFRVHDLQKTTANYDVGRKEMRILRAKYLGHVPSQTEVLRAMLPYLSRQFVFHWSYRLGLLRV